MCAISGITCQMQSSPIISALLYVIFVAATSTWASEPVVRGFTLREEGEVLCWRRLTNLTHSHPSRLRREVKLFMTAAALAGA
jgi:hypothetical protein